MAAAGLVTRAEPRMPSSRPVQVTSYDVAPATGSQVRSRRCDRGFTTTLRGATSAGAVGMPDATVGAPYPSAALRARTATWYLRPPTRPVMTAGPPDTVRLPRSPGTSLLQRTS